MPPPAAPADPPPVAPTPPDFDECCGSGCNPCIFDLHDQALERYRAELLAWTSRQQARGDGR